MNPLSTFKYTKNNFRKALPILVAMTVGVLLIYLFSLITKSTEKMTDLTYTNLFSKYTMLCSNNENPIPKDYLDKISTDSNVGHIIPIIKNDGNLQYNGAFGSMTINCLNLHKDDISKFLDSLNVKLTKGAFPKENTNEIIVSKEYALQKKLKIGDYIGSEVSFSYGINGKYKITGITEGPAIVAITSNNRENIPREQIMNHAILFSIKDIKDKSLINYLSQGTPKNIVITDYYSIKNTMDDMLSIIGTLTFTLTGMIIIVMCISLGNLNYISFLNRKYEFGVLSAIGYKKSSLYFKLWKENSFVCLLGYISGILLTTLVAFLLNQAVLYPTGKFIPLWNGLGAVTAFLIPVFVSFLSLILPVKELRKTEALDVIGGVI